MKKVMPLIIYLMFTVIIKDIRAWPLLIESNIEEKLPEFFPVPKDNGLKYFYEIRTSINYVDRDIFWIWGCMPDYSSFVTKMGKNKGVGGLFKLGFVNYVGQRFFIDLFTQYLYQRFSFKRIHEDHYTIRNNLNMAGLKLGAGVGIYF